jgi:hypothetical protein
MSLALSLPLNQQMLSRSPRNGLRSGKIWGPPKCWLLIWSKAKVSSSDCFPPSRSPLLGPLREHGAWTASRYLVAMLARSTVTSAEDCSVVPAHVRAFLLTTFRSNSALKSPLGSAEYAKKSSWLERKRRVTQRPQLRHRTETISRRLRRMKTTAPWSCRLDWKDL